MIYGIMVDQLIGQNHICCIVLTANIISCDICPVIDRQVILPVTHYRNIWIANEEINKVFVTDHCIGNIHSDLRGWIDPDPNDGIKPCTTIQSHIARCYPWGIEIRDSVCHGIMVNQVIQQIGVSGGILATYTQSAYISTIIHDQVIFPFAVNTLIGITNIK